MLRHYDSIGLLRPARVDDRTGYRFYENDQLPQLNRIVELRSWGCALADIVRVMDATDSDGALREVLENRRAELHASLVVETERLARVEARLLVLEGSTMTAVEYRRLEPVTVYALSGVAPGMGPENVSPVIDELLPPLISAITGSGQVPLEPGVFWYESRDDEQLGVTVSFSAPEVPVASSGYEVVTLPEVPVAAVLVHYGEMPRIGDSWMALIDQLVADGYRMVGPTREVYVHAPDDAPQSEWITELQVPVELVSP